MKESIFYKCYLNSNLLKKTCYNINIMNIYMRLINTKMNYLSKNNKTIYDFKVKDYKGNTVYLEKYKKYKALIIVNVASY